MKPSREDVLAFTMETLRSMGDEWEDAVELSEDTRIMGNLNWRSIEIVYLANAMQQHFEQTFPFEEFLQHIEAREQKDITVGEWVDFLHANLADPPSGDPLLLDAPVQNVASQAH